MSKRQFASVQMTGKKRAFKFPVKVVAIASGTGTVAAYGVISVDATAKKTYITVSSGTNIGTQVGTAR